MLILRRIGSTMSFHRVISPIIRMSSTFHTSISPAAFFSIKPTHHRSLHSTIIPCKSTIDSKNTTAPPTDGDDNTIQSPPQQRTKRRRLDEACLQLHPEYSRNVIQSWIAQGKVLVNDKPVLKAGTPIPSTATIIITAEQPKYVCRAGLKLEAALKHFHIDPTGFTCLDSGLSTGGFTDCLLQHGARKVYGVDVGYGQVAEKIRQDARVIVMERTNLRHLRRQDFINSTTSNSEGEEETSDMKIVDMATLDLSFISVLKVRECVCDVLKPNGHLVVLVKPQFEAGKKQVGTGGVVKDPEVHAEVIRNVIAGWEEVGFECKGFIESPIKGATSGNTEFLAYFVKTTTS